MQGYAGLPSDAVVGYTFNADNYCPNCVIGAYNGNSDCYDSEAMLDILAGLYGIERMDEHSFDSDYFPKVIFADSATADDYCGACGERLDRGDEY